MFDVLNSSLYQHSSISIPGLGTIYLENLPASIDSATHQMLPPIFYFLFYKFIRKVN